MSTMNALERNNDESSYATACQILEFNSVQDCENSIEIENSRKILAVKYLNDRLLSNDFTTTLLSRNLAEYSGHRHREPLKPPKNLNTARSAPLNFKSGLKDSENPLLKFLDPLPCERAGKTCRNRSLQDKDIRQLMTRHFPAKKNPKVETPDVPTSLLPKRKNWMNSSNSPPNPAPKMPKLDPEELPRSNSSGIFRTANTIQQMNDKVAKDKDKLKRKDSLSSKFVCPIKRENKKEAEAAVSKPDDSKETCEDDRLKNIDEKMIELIRNEIMDGGATVDWEDVAGLAQVKKVIKEIVVFPMLRPDIFTGLRRPPKGILLFGPPGTGKTLIGKCVASQSKSTFFSISASSLTSKWVGEGEKMVRALFAVAKVHQPSVVFIDEIDSLLTQRSETEHESSRRIKTEFLVQLDGATTGEDDRVLVIGATNRPQELDEAARRRFVKRLYIPLPETNAREQIVENLLRNERHDLRKTDIANIASLTADYSGADMANLCKEASMGPIRSIPFDELENIDKDSVRCVTLQDFKQAINLVRPSVSQADLNLYITWDQTFGSGTSGNAQL